MLSKSPQAAPLQIMNSFPFTINPADLYFGVYPNYANSPLPIGSVGVVTVDNGGSGYSNPTLTIVDDYVSTASGATATATVTGGVITAITVTNGGSGYVAPIVIITDPSGMDAMATAHLDPATLTGGIPKFVDDLPRICEVSGPSQSLQSCLPLAKADTSTFPGSDFYQIGLKDYFQKLHSNLPPTKLRGYIDLSSSADGDAHYLGPLIIAQRNRPVRVLFKNLLPVSGSLDTNGVDQSKIFIPMDSSYMGAGQGPDGSVYTENRAVLHLHGGNTPWISDGTPHQWITPAGDSTTLKKGVSFQNVPDMIGPGKPIVTPSDGDGLQTYYWTNQQSGRLMFYHDHSYGTTRLNVYAGEAAGYLLVDPQQEDLLRAATVPGTIPGDGNGGIDVARADLSHMVPLIIQDKTFVDANTLKSQDPTWKWGSQPGTAVTGDLWFPHVYMPNQWPDNPDLSGSSPMGRWDYGPWFWPPQDPKTFVPQGQPFLCQSANIPTTFCPGTPNPSGVPEGFMDTPVVNGVAYPVLHVSPEAYRFQILNAANDRAWNLQLYQAYDPESERLGTGKEVKMVPAVPGSWPVGWPTPDAREGGWPDPSTVGPQFIQIGTEGGLLPSPVAIQNRPIGYEYGRRSITVLNVFEKALMLGPAERADVVVDFSRFANQTLILYNDAPAPVPAFDARNDYYTGDPDQTSTGGAPPTVPGYGPNTRTIMQIIVDLPSTGAGPFSLSSLQMAMPTIFAATQDPMLIPEKAYGFPNNTYSTIQATSLDYMDPSGTISGVTVTNGGSRYTNPVVTFVGGGATVTASATATVKSGVITGITVTNGGSGYTALPAISISDSTGTGATAKVSSHSMQPKAIQELFTLDYGRMNATLGVELPFTNFMTQTTIPYGYIDVPTEVIKDGETQIWKITHNGVDTHFVHFHLFTVQVLNRVGWDGAIKPPDANEMSWKDTVRMNPLEDVIVAAKAVKQNLPWPIPDSIRPLDVTAPLGTTGQFTNIDPHNNPVTVYNTTVNFGWEYIWHCHLLGHEENDMMRPMIFQVPPPSPSNMKANGITLPSLSIYLQWQDNSASEEGFTVQRADDAGFTQNVAQLNAPAAPGFGSVVSFTDSTAGRTAKAFYYRVQAYSANGISSWSIPAQTAYPPVAMVTPLTLTFGNQAVGTSSTSKSITIVNGGSGKLIVSGISLGGLNPSDFAQTNTCSSDLAGGATCTIIVTFGPTGAGARTANVTISSNDALSPTFTVALNGTGTAPTASIAPIALNFPDQAVGITSAGQSVVLSNTGLAALAVSSIKFNGTSPADFAQNNSCGSTVAAGAKCAISVTFRPTAIGARTASLTVSSSDPANPSLVVAVGGNGIVLTLPPMAPTSLAAVLQGTNTVNLSWKDNANNELGYYIERSRNNSTWTRIATLGANVVTYADGGLNRRTTYWYRVQAYNASGTSSYSNTASTTTR
jgi:FtsP/CotA-like multicopper oxidase with cupredoxin domain